MDSGVRVRVNGQTLEVPPGTLAAAALRLADVDAVRRSVTGEPRGPLCGMGICFECRATIDGQTHRLSCQTVCREGMEIRSDG